MSEPAVIVPVSLLEAVIGYLKRCPYEDVWQIMSVISSSIRQVEPERDERDELVALIREVRK